MSGKTRVGLTNSGLLIKSVIEMSVGRLFVELKVSLKKIQADAFVEKNKCPFLFAGNCGTNFDS
jgi:hypothetical protein